MSSNRRTSKNTHAGSDATSSGSNHGHSSCCCCRCSWISFILLVTCFLVVVLASIIVFVIYSPNKDDDTHLQVLIARTQDEVRRCNATKVAPSEFVFPFLDAPRTRDERHFCYLPASRGGVLRQPSPKLTWSAALRRAAQAAYEMFALFDEKEKNEQQRDDVLEVYGTMCVGIDCEFITDMIVSLKTAGIGHFIVVVNTDDPKFVDFFTTLAELFPGRFSTFVRPNKLSCAESWNLVIRLGFSIRPMPDQVFIANADWSLKQFAQVPNAFEDYIRYSRLNSNFVINRFYHFSSFSYMRKGYIELGYADETLMPALSEDVELHLRAVSKNMGELGLYPHYQAASNHRKRASAKERDIVKRNGRAARWNYILQKYGVSVPQHVDFARAKPFKTPFNLPIAHNNSWALLAPNDEFRMCVRTGSGRKYKNNNGRCWWNPEVLKSILLNKDVPLHPYLFSMIDNFPGSG